MFAIRHPHRILSFFFRTAVASSALLAACQFDPTPVATAAEENPGQGTVTVELQIRPVALAKGAAVSTTDSTNVVVSSPDANPRQFGFGNGTDVYSLPELTPGPKRHFDVRMYRQGRLMYLGTADTTLYTDRKNTVFLHCIPQFSRVSAGVHIPLDFPRKVGRTELRLWNETDTMVVGPDQPGEFLGFHVEEVPGDRNYHMMFSLWNDTGALNASSYRDSLWVPMGQPVSLNLPLTTTFSQLQVNMTVADPQQTQVSFSFPAGKRVPTAFGEVAFSEVFLTPSSQDSGVQGQYLELYNRTSDTLDLSSCKVARDGGGSTSKQAVLAAGTLVAPGRGFVLGRSAVPFADVKFSSFSLGSTGISHVNFSCKSGALTLDSIAYSTAASDSTAVQMATGKVTELRPDWIANRVDPKGWCSVPAHPVSSSEGKPTPGTLENGCPQ